MTNPSFWVWAFFENYHRLLHRQNPHDIPGSFKYLKNVCRFTPKNPIKRPFFVHIKKEDPGIPSIGKYTCYPSIQSWDVEIPCLQTIESINLTQTPQAIVPGSFFPASLPPKMFAGPQKEAGSSSFPIIFSGAIC